MSLFDGDNDDVRASIEYFNGIPDAEKIAIITNLAPEALKQSPHYGRLFPLLARIQSDIPGHSDAAIGNRLAECGMDRTYAALFVPNMKKHAPTQEYILGQIGSIDDGDFGKKIPGIFNDLWVRCEDDAVVSERHGVDPEVVQCLTSLAVVAFNDLCSGNASKDTLERAYGRHLSEMKAGILANQLAVNSDHWRRAATFRSLRELSAAARQLVAKNDEILSLLNDLVEMRRRDLQGR